MYANIKSDAITEQQAIEIVGQENIDKVLAKNCDYTNRLIDDVYGQTEFSASINCADKDGNEVTLTVLYLVDTDTLTDCEDLGNLDWSNYTFTID